MKYVIFENDGTIEPQLIKSFGVSVKADASCIGFFGTGLKYALAIAQREGAKVSIYSGYDVMRFGVEGVTLKDKEFQFVTMNGEILPFTTELGKTWKPWMAYREFYSNAKDEGGNAYLSDELPAAASDKTYVVVAGGGFDVLHNGREAIFVDEESAISPNIYPNGGSFYSKGVCVWKYEGMPSIYSYDDSAGICTLTEDRQIGSYGQAHKVVSELLVKVQDRDVIRAVVFAGDETYEGRVDYDYCSLSPSPEFIEIALAGIDKITNKYLKKYVQKYAPKAVLKEFALTPYQQEMYDEAVFAAKMAGFLVDDYPVKFVKSLGKGVLGQALDGEILIAEDCFLQGGAEMLKAALIEEWVHLEHGYADCERAMQNYLFAQIVRMVNMCNASVKARNAA